MRSLKRFIKYYKPYRSIFYFDLLCAAIISLVDLAYPQILRRLTRTLFQKEANVILHYLPMLGIGLLGMYIIQTLCKYYVSCQG
ncbi:MAG TPA: ABC transporter ATP-binding protein, partial [Lachnospiraceae bacterium]